MRAGYALDQSRLARAVVSQQSGDLSDLGLEVNAPQRLDCAEIFDNSLDMKKAATTCLCRSAWG